MSEYAEQDKLYTAMHPTRFEILLKIKDDPSYASKLAKEMDFDRRLISFHLSMLERYGLVRGEFGLKNEPEERPVVVKYFSLTKDGGNILSRAISCSRPT